MNRLPRDVGVEAKVGFGDGAVVVGPELVGSEVVGNSVLVGPNAGGSSDEVHDRFHDGVDLGVRGHGAMVTHVHNEAETASEDACSNSPPVRLLLGNEEGRDEVENNSDNDLGECKRLVEVAAPAYFAKLFLHTLANGAEETVVGHGVSNNSARRERRPSRCSSSSSSSTSGSRLVRGREDKVANIVLIEPVQSLGLGSGRVIALHQVSTVAARTETHDITTGVLVNELRDVVYLVVHNSPGFAVRGGKEGGSGFLVGCKLEE